MTVTSPARIRRADEDAIVTAASILRAGGLVAFPTETVYGLGADATNGDAVAAIFAAKARPHFNPLIVHEASLERAELHARFNSLARKLAEEFWPGPLTLVLPRKSDSKLSLLVSAGLDTVALRVPWHDVAVQLIAKFGGPIAAPSANRSGHVTATTAADAANDLTGINLVLDAGPTPVGIESTVIAIDGDTAFLLRPGGVAREAIEQITGPLRSAGDGVLGSPGRLPSHYAPNAALRLNVSSVQPEEALLAFGASIPAGARHTLNLSPGANVREAAANLFSMLRALDSSGAKSIAVMSIPSYGLGEAINDRLARAAAPRPA